MKGFRSFILRGNVVDLAVGIVIGAAFTAVVNGFVGAFLTSLVGLARGATGDMSRKPSRSALLSSRTGPSSTRRSASCSLRPPCTSWWSCPSTSSTSASPPTRTSRHPSATAPNASAPSPPKPAAARPAPSRCPRCPHGPTPRHSVSADSEMTLGAMPRSVRLRRRLAAVQGRAGEGECRECGARWIAGGGTGGSQPCIAHRSARPGPGQHRLRLQNVSTAPHHRGTCMTGSQEARRSAGVATSN